MNIKEQYDKVFSERETIIKQISELENNNVVKKYLDLCSQKEQLTNQQKDLYEKMKFKEYSSCEHIWVNVFNFSGYDRTYRYNGCIKCGLDQSVLWLREEYGSNFSTFVPFEKQVMFYFLRERFVSGTDTKIFCDLSLAKSIYSKIKEARPDIDDETAIKYLRVALDDIEKNKISDERKVSREKRLSLSPNFNHWDPWSIKNKY